MGRGERDRTELRDGYPPLPRLSLSLPTLSPLPMPCSASAACNRVTGSSTEQPSSLSLFLFPEVSRVSEEDGSAIKQLAVKVTDRRSRRVPLPIGGLTLFWNSMGRTFFGATLAVHPFHAPAFASVASVKFSWFKPYALEFARSEVRIIIGILGDMVSSTLGQVRFQMNSCTN